MKVILVQSVENLGDAGDIVTVKNGYGRNFLIPNGFAVSANKKSIIGIQKDLERKELKEAKTIKGLTLLSEKLKSLEYWELINICFECYSLNIY